MKYKAVEFLNTFAIITVYIDRDLLFIYIVLISTEFYVFVSLLFDRDCHHQPIFLVKFTVKNSH